MSYCVILQPRAWTQLEEHVGYIAADNPAAAERWFNRFLTAIESLANSPERCPLARESAIVNREIRQFIYGNRRSALRVYFAIEEKTVRILSIRHSVQQDLSIDELLDA